MDLGVHSAFILGAYGATLAILLGLSFWLWRDGRRYKTALSELERRGVKRTN